MEQDCGSGDRRAALLEECSTVVHKGDVGVRLSFSFQEFDAEKTVGDDGKVEVAGRRAIMNEPEKGFRNTREFCGVIGVAVGS